MSIDVVILELGELIRKHYMQGTVDGFWDKLGRIYDKELVSKAIEILCTEEKNVMTRVGTAEGCEEDGKPYKKTFYGPSDKVLAEAKESQ